MSQQLLGIRFLVCGSLSWPREDLSHFLSPTFWLEPLYVRHLPSAQKQVRRNRLSSHRRYSVYKSIGTRWFTEILAINTAHGVLCSGTDKGRESDDFKGSIFDRVSAYVTAGILEGSFHLATCHRYPLDNFPELSLASQQQEISERCKLQPQTDPCPAYELHR